jgi:hypothetical protein
MRYAKILLIILSILALIGCNERAQNPSTVSSQAVTGYIIDEPAPVAEPMAAEFDIRALENGYDPDTIIVRKGTVVMLNVLNDVSELEDDEIGLRRFSVSGYAPEEVTRDSGIMTVKFTADKTGEFEFGDESRNELKGLLIVN